MPLISVWLVQTPDGRWEPGIGDPTLVGWFTVFAYFGAAYLCFRAAQASRGPGTARPRVAWQVLMALMLALGINKQLDLQSLLTVVGKEIAMQEGWYRERREVQRWFIGAVFVGGVAALAASLWWMRAHPREFRLALVGAVCIVAFVLIRASSFHHVDAFLSGRTTGVRMNWVLELGGIACIALGARRSARIRRKKLAARRML